MLFRSSSASAAAVEALCAGYVADAQDAAVLAEEARDATLASFDSFDDRYLGPKDVDPETDNDGNPLQAGALHFNVGEGAMKLWTGSAWVAAYVRGGDYLERDRAWPIGSIYLNAANATNPAVLIGFGTWSAIGQGRVLLGAGSGQDANAESRTFAAGANGGEYRHVLAADEMPLHDHFAFANAYNADDSQASSTSTSTVGRSNGSGSFNYRVGNAGLTPASVGLTSAAGGGGAHNNLPPYLAVHMWVRTA